MVFPAIDIIGLFLCISYRHKSGMIYGYARVSTDGQSVAAQVAALRAAGAGKVFREVASGAKTDRAQLRKAIAALEAGDVLMVTRLDRLARSTRDLLNTLAAITGRKAGFRSLGDAWADTTTAHGRLMLTVLGGLADDAASAIMGGAILSQSLGGAWTFAAYSPHLGCHLPASLDHLDRPQAMPPHAVAFAAGRAW